MFFAQFLTLITSDMDKQPATSSNKLIVVANRLPVTINKNDQGKFFRVRLDHHHDILMITLQVNGTSKNHQGDL